MPDKDISPIESVSRTEVRVSNSLVSPLFFSVLFGFAAGAVGMMFVAAYFLPTPEVSGGIMSSMRGRTIRVTDEYGTVPTPVEAASRSLALIYRAKPSGTSLLDQAYLPQDVVAAGTVLTSDGWLVTSDDAVRTYLASTKKVNLVASVGTRLYAVQSVVHDDYSGAYFLKVDATNLAVVPFSDASDLGVGDALFVYDALRGAHRADFIGYGRALPQTANDYVVSSERLQTVLRLSSSADAVTGSMIVDVRGGFVGVLGGTDKIGAHAIPLHSFENQLRDILRGKAPVRSYLGVNYIDLSQIISGAATGQAALGRGALLSASAVNHLPAIVANSPAKVAGLVAGDVVTAVNDQEISAQNPLADVIADYSPDTEVTLAIQRGESGANLTVKVKLGSTPAGN